MCRELTESLLIGCLTESTWNPKSKSNMLIPKTNLEPQIQSMFLERREESPSVLIQHQVFFDIFWQPFEKFFLANQCHVDTRTRHNLEWWVSDGKSPTYQCVVARSVQRGCLVTRIGISSQSGDWIQQEKSWSSRGKLGSSISNSEVGSSQVYRQEMVNLAARRLGQKGLTWPKSEEDSPSTGQPVAVSPEMENMKFSNYPYVEKIFQCVQKKLEELQWILCF